MLFKEPWGARTQATELSNVFGGEKRRPSLQSGEGGLATQENSRPTVRRSSWKKKSRDGRGRRDVPPISYKGRKDTIAALAG